MSVKMAHGDDYRHLLLQKVKEIKQTPPSITKAMLKKMFKKNSKYITSKELRMALSCPLGKTKIQVSFIFLANVYFFIFIFSIISGSLQASRLFAYPML